MQSPIFNTSSVVTRATLALLAQLVKNLLAMQETPVQFLGQEYSWAFLVVQTVKNPPAMWESWVQSLDWKHPLEKRKATHCKIFESRVAQMVKNLPANAGDIRDVGLIAGLKRYPGDGHGNPLQ